MSMYNVYPIKRDFERGSGAENHEFYYFINYTNDSWIFIIKTFMSLKFYHVLIVLIHNSDYVPYFHIHDTNFISISRI